MAVTEVQSARIARRVAPVEKPELLPFKTNHIKIRLRFVTYTPCHERSFALIEEADADPPYAEDTCILMHCSKVFTRVETFLPAFRQLQEADVVPEGARLKGYQLLPEDDQTLAYLIR